MTDWRPVFGSDLYEGGLPSIEELMSASTASPGEVLDAAREQLGLARHMPARPRGGCPGVSDLREELGLHG